ncbi:hypothetical protein PFUGPA_00717 [Plasmodium falciparum Palo Alto/Uganda]|nr:hypothetical protein PFUGPA_00717 [Plasmodium falciparum Palo Alto/Uganda]
MDSTKKNNIYKLNNQNDEESVKEQKYDNPEEINSFNISKDHNIEATDVSTNKNIINNNIKEDNNIIHLNEFKNIITNQHNSYKNMAYTNMENKKYKESETYIQNKDIYDKIETKQNNIEETNTNFINYEIYKCSIDNDTKKNKKTLLNEMIHMYHLKGSYQSNDDIQKRQNYYLTKKYEKMTEDNFNETPYELSNNSNYLINTNRYNTNHTNYNIRGMSLNSYFTEKKNINQHINENNINQHINENNINRHINENNINRHINENHINQHVNENNINQLKNINSLYKNLESNIQRQISNNLIFGSNYSKYYKNINSEEFKNTYRQTYNYLYKHYNYREPLKRSISLQQKIHTHIINDNTKFKENEKQKKNIYTQKNNFSFDFLRQNHYNIINNKDEHEQDQYRRKKQNRYYDYIKKDKKYIYHSDYIQHFNNIINTYSWSNDNHIYIHQNKNQKKNKSYISTVSTQDNDSDQSNFSSLVKDVFQNNSDSYISSNDVNHNSTIQKKKNKQTFKTQLSKNNLQHLFNQYNKNKKNKKKSNKHEQNNLNNLETIRTTKTNSKESFLQIIQEANIFPSITIQNNNNNNNNNNIYIPNLNKETQSKNLSYPEQKKRILNLDNHINNTNHYDDFSDNYEHILNTSTNTDISDHGDFKKSNKNNFINKTKNEHEEHFNQNQKNKKKNLHIYGNMKKYKSLNDVSYQNNQTKYEIIDIQKKKQELQKNASGVKKDSSRHSNNIYNYQSVDNHYINEHNNNNKYYKRSLSHESQFKENKNIYIKTNRRNNSIHIKLNDTSNYLFINNSNNHKNTYNSSSIISFNKKKRNKNDNINLNYKTESSTSDFFSFESIDNKKKDIQDIFFNNMKTVNGNKIKNIIKDNNNNNNKKNNKRKNNINIDNHYTKPQNVHQQLTKQKKILIEPQKLLAAIQNFKNHKKSLELDNKINQNNILKKENKNNNLSKQNYLCNVINSDDDTSEHMFVYATK